MHLLFIDSAPAIASEALSIPVSQADCNIKKPLLKFYHGIKRIALDVVVMPAVYEEAQSCHGREIDCVQECKGTESACINLLAGFEKDDHSGRALRLQNLVEVYKRYPAPLYRGRLVDLFSQKIQRDIVPYIEVGAGCSRPDVHVLDFNTMETPIAGGLPRPKNSEVNFQKDENTLTVKVTVSFVDNTDPRIAILEFDFVKWCAVCETFSSHGQKVTAIPLDISDSKISELLGNFVERLQIIGSSE